MKPNDARTRRAITFLWLNLSAHIILIVLDSVELMLLQRAKTDNSMEVINLITTSDLIQLIFAGIYLVILVLTYIFYIQWFRRAYYNLHFQSDYLSYSEGWAAGFWFIPVLNLYYPYKIMKEIFSETLSVLGKSEDDFPRALLRTWWFLYILGSVISQIASRLQFRADDIDELIKGDMISIAGSIVVIFAAIFAVKVIRRYEPLQEELYATSQEGDFTRHLAPETE